MPEPITTITVGKFLLGELAGAAIKRVIGAVGEKKDELVRALSAPAPALDEVVQQTFAKAYLESLEKIVNIYTASQHRSMFVAPEESQPDEAIAGKLAALKRKHLTTVATRLNRHHVIVSQSGDEGSIRDALMETVREDFGDVPEDLLSHFERGLLPSIKDSMWQQLVKPPGEGAVNEPLTAYVVQTLERVGVAVADLQTIVSDIHRQLATDWKLAGGTMRQDIEGYVRAVERYCDNHPNRSLVEFLGRARRPLSSVYVPPRLRHDDSDDDAAEHPAASEIIRANENKSDFRCLMFRGEAGAGKSTLLRQLALHAWSAPHLIGLTGPHLPLLVSLQALSLVQSADVSGRMKGALDKSGGVAFAAALPEDFFLSWPQRSGIPWVILLDGLDEVPSNKLGETAEWLEALLEIARECGHLTVISSRPFSLMPVGLVDKVRAYDVLSFSPGQRQDFSVAWFGGDAGLFLAEVDRVRAANLSETPLLLTIAAAVYSEDKRLPETRDELYQRLVRILLSEAKGRGLEIELGSELADIAEPVLENLALAAAENPTEMNISALKRVATSYLRDYLQLPRAVLVAKADSVVDSLGRHSGIFSCQRDACEWTHPTIRDYLAARSLSTRLAEGDPYELLLAGRLSNVELDNVFVTLARLAPDPVGIIVWMCSQVTGDRHARIALLAEECLGKSPAAVDKRANEAVLNALVMALGDTQTGMVIEREVRAALVEKGPQAVEPLLKKLAELNSIQGRLRAEGLNSEGQPDLLKESGDALNRSLRHRSNILKVLGRIGDARAVPPLLSLLDEDPDDYYRHYISDGAAKSLKILLASADDGSLTIKPILALLADDSTSDPRKLILLNALGFIGLRGNDVPPVLDRLLQSSCHINSALCGETLKAAGRLRDTSQTDYAVDGLASHDLNVVGSAAWFLMQSPAAKALPDLELAFQRVIGGPDQEYLKSFVLQRILIAIARSAPEGPNKAAELIKTNFGHGEFRASDVINLASEESLPNIIPFFLSEFINGLSLPEPPDYLAVLTENLASEWDPKRLEEMAGAWREAAALKQELAHQLVSDLISLARSKAKYPYYGHDYLIAAIKVLSKCAEPDFALEVSRFLELDDWFLCVTVSEILWVAGDPRAQDALLTKLGRLTGPYERDQTISILHALGTCATGAGAERVLAHILTRSEIDFDIQDDVLWPLTRRGEVSREKLLEIMGSDASEQIRYQCFVALARLANPEDEPLFVAHAFPTEEKPLGGNVAFRVTALSRLGITGDPKVIPQVKDLLITTDDPRIVKQCAVSLTMLRAEEAVPELEQAFRKFSKSAASSSLLNALAQFHSETSRDLIFSHLKSKWWFVVPRHLVRAAALYSSSSQVLDFILGHLGKWGGPGVNRGDQAAVIYALLTCSPELILPKVIELYRAGRLDQSARLALAENLSASVDKIDLDDLSTVLKLLLTDHDLMVRETAGQALRFLNAGLRESAFRELQASPSVWDQACAVHSLGFWAIPGSAEEQAIIDAIYSPEQCIRHNADAAKRRMERDRHWESLADMYLKDSVNRVAAFLAIQDSINDAILWRLDTILPKDAPARAFLDMLANRLRKREKDNRSKREKDERDRLICLGAQREA
jgi:HEAT repeat protein